MGFAFGGPLLRIPAARTRESRRLRVAVVASVLFHGSLLAGGALLTAAGSLRGGGTVAAVEIVLDTRGLATGPMADRTYAPPRETAERAPEEPPAETLDEDALPTLAANTPIPQAPPELAAPETSSDSETPERLPGDEAPPELAALDPPAAVDMPEAPARAADAPLPAVLETPRGSHEPLVPEEQPPVAAPDPAAVAAPPEELAPLQAPTEAAETPQSPDPAPPTAAAPSAPAVAEAQEAASETPTAPAPPPPVLVTPQPPSPPSAPQLATLTPPPPPAAPSAVPPLLTPPAPVAEAPSDTASEPPAEAAEPPAPDPAVPTLDPPQVAAAESEPEPAAPEEPSPIDSLLASITPASLDTVPPPAVREDEALPPQLGAPEPPRSPVPEPERPPAEATSSAAPPALYLPPEPPPAETAPPPPAEDTPPPIGPVTWNQPFAPPPPDPRRVDPATRAGMAEALDAEISAILSEISCGDLQADAGADGRLSVRGYVTSLQQQAEIRDRLLGIADVRGVSDEAVVVIAEGLCDGLAVYGAGRATVAPDPEPMDHLPPALRRPPIFGMLQGARAEFVDGSYLEIAVESPDFPAHVTIDYFKPDGSVIHLLPSEWNTESYYPVPDTPITIANREPGDISVLAGPPYGTGMVVTLSTSEPLFASIDERPLQENAEAYLARLDTILRDKERNPEFQAQYGYVFVDAVRPQ